MNAVYGAFVLLMFHSCVLVHSFVRYPLNNGNPRDQITDECAKYIAQNKSISYTLPVPSECSKFAHCDASGSYVIQNCSAGMFFQFDRVNGTGACTYPQQVMCDSDPCRSNTWQGKYAVPGSCGMYFECSNGYSQAKTCASSQRFDDNANQCVRDYTCNSDITTTSRPCEYEAVPRKEGWFRVKNTTLLRSQMQCPSNLVFNNVECYCDYP